MASCRTQREIDDFARVVRGELTDLPPQTCWAPTLVGMRDIVADLYPDALIIVEEFPEMHCGIPRRFWARLWAAIRGKPVTEWKRPIGTVRIVISNSNPVDHDALREQIDLYRPVGIAVLLAEAQNAATHCGDCP